MDKLEKYRKIVRDFLIEQANSDQASADVECQFVFDSEHDHYQLLDVGWDSLKRIYACYIHIDIKEGQVWIQRNMTEANIAALLVEVGIPKEDIVIGLHPPYKRPHTGYGAIAQLPIK